MKSDCVSVSEETSYFRLIEAVSLQWEADGFAAMSARRISLAAGAPVSSIYHHFESLEHLFLASQRECRSRAAAWCEAQLAQVFDLEGRLEHFAEFFAHIVDAWSQGCRPLAFAWRECELLAARSPLFVDEARCWRAVWRDFWQCAGVHFGLGDGVFLVERLFDSESLFHMITWRRAIDRAALGEIARGVVSWLSGEPALAAPWRDVAHAAVLRDAPRPVERDDATKRIMAAAAELVGAQGVAGVTHRAVADRAGATLGAVSHKFRTKAALLNAAFEGLYAAMTGQDAEPEVPPRASLSPEVLADEIASALPRSARLAGVDDLAVSAARDPLLSAFGAQLRYLRGRSSRAALQAIVGRSPSLLEGAMFSAFLSAQMRRGDVCSKEGMASIKGELRQLVALLAPSSSMAR